MLPVGGIVDEALQEALLRALLEPGIRPLLLHGLADASDQLVRVHAELIGDRLHVEVADSGRWRPPEPRPDRGLGIQLIEALMTFVDIRPSDTGTRVVMERSLTRERVGGNGVGVRE